MLLVWIADLLPNEVAGDVRAMMDQAAVDEAHPGGARGEELIADTELPDGRAERTGRSSLR